MFKGDVYLPEVPGMIFTFRSRRFVAASDVRRAFHQLLLRPDHANCARWIWFKDPSKGPAEGNILILRFKRLPMGFICSPFLIAASIRYHLTRVKTPLALEIKDQTYSDNVLLVADTEDELIAKCIEAKRLFESMSMDLRDFVSNDQNVNDRLSVAVDQPVRRPLTKFLGLTFDATKDLFVINNPISEKDMRISVITKRTVVKRAARFQ